MATSKNNPGKLRNANLPIGRVNDAIQENGAPRWHSRGYLPHFESSDVTQHVTFHLADSLPQTVLTRLEAELKFLPAEKRDAERRKRVDAWIDAGHGSCVLRDPAIADMVQDSLLTFDSQRYRLLAWVVMPNHVHILFQPINRWTVAKIVAAWKKFTARKICDERRDSDGRIPGTPISRLAAVGAVGTPISRLATVGVVGTPISRLATVGVVGTPISRLAASSPVWHREYWDRYIRDEGHLAHVIEYIHLNPVRAGLAATPEHWPWSSAYRRSANL